MPSLSRDNRKLLENTVVAARSIAERGAEKSLISLGVGQREAPGTLSQQERILRNQLRAHGRQLGDSRHPSGAQETRHLMQALAYEHWHRMLFARFLAENDLLMHPEYGIAISMDEVREAAREQGVDWLTLAMDCAQHMLIEVFRADDPVLHAVLPPETRMELEQKLEQLPVEVFTAEDSLGWVYQFWQSDEKERVNKSEVKIGADELAPVTQLFTEDYMVLFLLHNTLGAWWTARRRAEGKGNELQGYEWTYLRLNEDGSPAAGSFNGWPKQLGELRVLDPCMGSGHFLAFALPILAKMAEIEYALTPGEAVHSVLIENLYGLELDARCSQIAAFNLALTAWRFIGRYVPLPPMNLACSGLGINASEESWVALAGNNALLKDTLAELYSTFQKAPILGSLIDPTRVGQPLLFARFDEVWPLLERALSAEQSTDDYRELAIAARGVLAAARILAGTFTLVATNVPFLGRGKQSATLAQYCDQFHSDAKADLTTCFVDRCMRLCSSGGSTILVTPQNWLFLTTYKKLRERLLITCDWTFVAQLGPNAFQIMNWWAANTSLLCLTRNPPQADRLVIGWDISDNKLQSAKSVELRSHPTLRIPQSVQLTNPNVAISLHELGSGQRLADFALSVEGLSTGDSDRYLRCFWELRLPEPSWELFQTSPSSDTEFAGLELCIQWGNGSSDLQQSKHARIQGQPAWGRPGVVVSRMNELRASLSVGAKHDKICVVISPKDQAHLPAIWAYCSSKQYNADVRKLFPRLDAATGSLNKVPFELAYWDGVAKERYPDGLPTPDSCDPTQSVFSGRPMYSRHVLQVAVARLVGYRWPRQSDCHIGDYVRRTGDDLDNWADPEGIVCLSAVSGRDPAAIQLRVLLEKAYGPEWSASKLEQLIMGERSIETWLRDKFFEEHCAVFHNRPFVWHISDGRTDGFHALVNYHRLAGPNGEGRRTLEKLIYTSLGDWIGRQRADVAAGADGAEARLSAATHLRTELEKILAGEAPYDIFVRWKPLDRQPIGWEPDLNDGVRLNIRPWLEAKPYKPTRRDSSILRVTPRIAFGKDRGKEPARDKEDFPWFAGNQDRTNDVHLALDEKRKARERKKS